MRALSLLLVAWISLALAPSAQAQAVIVEADAGAVLVDGERRGAPGDTLDVSPGERAVWLVDAPEAWNPRIDSARVTLARGDTARLTLALPVRYRLETRPTGAEVTLASPDGAERSLGLSPVTVDLPATSVAEWRIALEGHVQVRQAVGGTSLVQIDLAPEPGARRPPEVQTLAMQRASARRRALVDLGIGAATLAAGAVAVYYKFEADAVDDQYRDPDSLRRGDEALRQEALRLDRRSGIALGAMQVGMGVLALRFVLR